MEWGQIFAFVATFLGGAFGVELIRTFRSGGNRAVGLANDIYPLWAKEVDRLAKQIDILHALIMALESELILLGGDPIKVRLDVMRKDIDQKYSSEEER